MELTVSRKPFSYVILGWLVFTAISATTIECAEDGEFPEILPKPFTYSRTELESWVAPDEIRRGLPYYQAGYDKEGRPVIVAEFGKWNVRTIVDTYPNGYEMVGKYYQQFFYRVSSNTSLPGFKNGVFVINDADGLDIRQLTGLRTVQTAILGMQLAQLTFDPDKSTVAVININAVMETLLTVLKPFGGEFVSMMEAYGTNKERWIPKLLERIPKDQLPEWYGGSKGFKPAKLF